MARDENCPIMRGDTFYNGATIDTNDLGGTQWEGTIWRWEDRVWNSSTFTAGAKPNRSNRPVYTMIVRNVAAAAILPKRLVKPQTGGSDGKYFLGRVDGYITTLAAGPAYAVDEFLPSAGCPVNDLCHVVIEGPAMVTTGLAADATNSIGVGDVLVGLTAASSGATTSGRAGAQDLTGATAPLGNQIQNAIGRAISAATTSQTGVDLLVSMARRW